MSAPGILNNKNMNNKQQIYMYIMLHISFLCKMSTPRISNNKNTITNADIQPTHMCTILHIVIPDFCKIPAAPTITNK